MAKPIQDRRGLRAALHVGRRGGATLIGAALLFAAGAAAARPADVAGWNGLAWGVRGDAIFAAFGQRVEKLRAPIYLANAFVQLVVRDQEVAGWPFTALMLMDPGTGRLGQVVLRPASGRASPAMHAQALAAMTAALGAPDTTTDESRYQGDIATIDRRHTWTFPTTTVSLWFWAPNLAAPRKAVRSHLIIRYFPTAKK